MTIALTGRLLTTQRDRHRGPDPLEIAANFYRAGDIEMIITAVEIEKMRNSKTEKGEQVDG